MGKVQSLVNQIDDALAEVSMSRRAHMQVGQVMRVFKQQAKQLEEDNESINQEEDTSEQEGASEKPYRDSEGGEGSSHSDEGKDKQ